MGLFDAFKKKQCDICGGDIGLLGNRKLEDGNLCKNCAKKLSPWFEERRHSTIADIQAQLAYREENAQKLQNFHPTQILGEDYKVYIEDLPGQPKRFAVSREEPAVANADLIYLKDVHYCETDIRNTKQEITYKDSEGNRQSYDPPRYRYRYNFYIKLSIENNPYFDFMEFKINDSDVEIVEQDFFEDRLFRLTDKTHDHSYDRKWQHYNGICEEICEWMSAADREEAAPQPAAPAPGPKFCPYCGSPANGGKFCTECGASLK